MQVMPEAPPQISVSGTYELKVAPDEAYVSAGVETVHVSLAEAKRESDARMGKLLKFLKSSGIEDRDIQTDYLRVAPRYYEGAAAPAAPQLDPNGNPIRTEVAITNLGPTHYVVQRSLGIRLRQIGKFDSLVSGVITNGASHVHDVEFRTTELRKHRDVARQMAVRAAKAKADALTAELGVKVGKPIQISEYDSGGGWWNWSGFDWQNRWRGGGGGAQNSGQGGGQGGGGADKGETTSSVGQISVYATVSVTFRIE